jgi:hypothetical protein
MLWNMARRRVAFHHRCILFGVCDPVCWLFADAHDGPRYSAIYEIDGPHVLVSPGWADAVEEGRWPTQIRPFTHNRRHALYKVR